ncbi:MAG TPA: DinB family protein [Gemmatimonadaceae bacterium]|nr:DinB family protein [Gemmatimonadaceae bacterium]
MTHNVAPQFFTKMFDLSYGAMFRNLEGLTHDESLLAPPSGGNSLNWVVGHIVATRNRILPLVGVAPLWPREHAMLYSGRDDAGWSVERALALDTIKTDLARSQQSLLSALDAMPQNALAAATEQGQMLGDVLGFFHFHESYHGGQIALIRRLLGHAGVIKPPATPRQSGAYRIQP